MLDWFTGYVGYDASHINPELLIQVGRDGSIKRRTPVWEKAVGSHSSSIQIRVAHPTDGMLNSSLSYGYQCHPETVFRVSGNPVKYLQGHNLYGAGPELLGPVVRDMFRELPDEFISPSAFEEPLPSVHRSRVDINQMIDLNTHDQVHRWLWNAATATRSRSGRAMHSGTTVYWQRGSTHWEMKAYCKHCEMKANPPKVSPDVYEALLKAAEGKLRLELTLKRPELRDRGTLNEDIIWEKYEKITVGIMSEGVEAMKNHEDLSRRQIELLDNWLRYGNPAKYLSKTTFYKHRKAILESVGVDISNPRQKEEHLIDRSLFDIEELRPRVLRSPPKEIEEYIRKVS